MPKKQKTGQAAKKALAQRLKNPKSSGKKPKPKKEKMTYRKS